MFQKTHTLLAQVVAIKTIVPLLDLDDDSREIVQLQRECVAAGRAFQPDIVRATDAGREAGVQFLAMEVVDGIRVLKFIRRFRRSVALRRPTCRLGLSSLFGFGGDQAAAGDGVERVVNDADVGEFNWEVELIQGSDQEVAEASNFGEAAGTNELQWVT